jgi:septal ring factor EnvC (AmiA/AmiB activator)
MSRNQKGLAALALLTAFVIVGVLGCGPKPPCAGVDVTDVRSTQDECAAATDELDQARDARADLEAEVGEARSEISSLQGQPAALEERLRELQKGSGR